MHTNLSNLTVEEFYRLNGYISPQYADALLDAQNDLDDLKGIDCYLSEAKGCYPAEDFLDTTIDRLNTLAQHMYKGDNKIELLSIIESINEIVTETMQASEYGIDELRKARSIFKW